MSGSTGWKRPHLAGLAALPLALVLSAPPAAAAERGDWTVRGFAALVSPNGDDLRATLATGEPFRFSVDSGAGLGFEVEYRLTPRLGLTVAALAADLDADLAVTAAGAALADTESASFELWSLGADYHLTPASRSDLYVGAFAAITYFDDTVFLTETGRSDKLVFDDDTGFGIRLGVDRPFGASQRWLLTAGVRYLAVILEGEAAGQDADLDPLIVTVGVGYRF